jgi:hypothetical protein
MGRSRRVLSWPLRSSRSARSSSHHLINTGPRMPAASPRRISSASFSVSMGESRAGCRHPKSDLGQPPRLVRLVVTAQTKPPPPLTFKKSVKPMMGPGRSKLPKVSTSPSTRPMPGRPISSSSTEVGPKSTLNQAPLEERLRSNSSPGSDVDRMAPETAQCVRPHAAVRAARALSGRVSRHSGQPCGRIGRSRWPWPSL